MMYLLYDLLLVASALLAAPYYGAVMLLRGKYRRSLGPKLGFADCAGGTMTGSPRVWVHGVSVGEVTAAAPIVAALREHLPKACIVLSTSTETGREAAQRLVRDASAIIYYPLDFPWSVDRVLNRVQPDVFVLVETELWPNFLRSCRRRGVKVLMVNGRISPRSYRGYRATRFFWRRVLGNLDGAAMISPVDAERIGAMGMAAERVIVMGNAKFDALAARVSPALLEEAAALLSVGPGERILVAGSTHEGEEEVVLEAYRHLKTMYPRLILVLVPRHIDRADAVVSLARRAGVGDVLTLSEIRAGRRRAGEGVVVVDVIGELFKLYSLAAVVFCGGSLVPRGGQNILEAAAWGKIVLYGPSMEDFLEERNLLEEIGAGITVRNAAELRTIAARVLAGGEEWEAKSRRAREAIADGGGAAGRYAAWIAAHLREREVRRSPQVNGKYGVGSGL